MAKAVPFHQEFVKQPPAFRAKARLALTAFALLLACTSVHAQPTQAAMDAFALYTRSLEARLIQQHRSPETYLADQENQFRIRGGEFLIEKLNPGTGEAAAGALLHHWRGTAFAPGATAADFEHLISDFAAYPQHFAPEVLRTSVLSRTPGQTAILMRVRQHHVITVVMDTTYDVSMGRTDASHGYSVSRSTRIAEVASPGTANERTLRPDEEHGFLYRLNTYWSYEQRDGGLYLQLETVSLTRAIPHGLGWVVKPFVESIPRESLNFTLQSAIHALQK